MNLFKKKDSIFEQYKHHGKLVWVIKLLKGKHRTVCLCYKCKKFYPDNRDKNCIIANLIYSNCKITGCVTPVWECPRFEDQKSYIE